MKQVATASQCGSRMQTGRTDRQARCSYQGSASSVPADKSNTRDNARIVSHPQHPQILALLPLFVPVRPFDGDRLRHGSGSGFLLLAFLAWVALAFVRGVLDTEFDGRDTECVELGVVLVPRPIFLLLGFRKELDTTGLAILE